MNKPTALHLMKVISIVGFVLMIILFGGGYIGHQITELNKTQDELTIAQSRITKLQNELDAYESAIYGTNNITDNYNEIENKPTGTLSSYDITQFLLSLKDIDSTRQIHLIIEIPNNAYVMYEYNPSIGLIQQSSGWPYYGSDGISEKGWAK